MTVAADERKVLDYLKSQGLLDTFATAAGAKPAEVAKDLTVADVHVPSASGQEPNKPKPTTFSDALAESDREDEAETPGAGAAKVVKVEDTDVEIRFVVSKADVEQRKVWGWASVSQVGQNVIIDKQGDMIPIEELEKAVYDYVLVARQMGDMHERIGVGDTIESMVFTPEKEKLGVVAKNEKGETIYGWWIGFQIDSASLWDAYKRGERPEFSIGGRSASYEV